MAQVKFYSVSTLPEIASTTGAGGVYFVDGGELYKGAQRFGANKVFTKGENQNLASFSSVGQIGGDILVGIGAAKVWDPATGSNGSWVDLGADNTALQSMWQADISTWTAGLVAGGEGSYITGITQGADGKVTASAAAFPTLNLDSHTEGSTVNGVTVSVTTQSGAVTGVSLVNPFVATASSSTGNDGGIYVTVSTENGQVTGVGVSADELNVTSITANSGTFTNLTVSDTATFSATTVSATTLTIGGSTVNQIAQSEIAAVTANTITATGTSLPTESAVATYVSAAVSNLAGAMHFKGTATITKTGEAITVSNFSETFTPAGGDVVVDTTNNLEAVYTGSAWELLGSNSVYALDAYAPGTESVTEGTSTLGGAVHAIASAFDNLGTAASKNYADSLTAAGTSLPTESAVATYVTGVVAGLDATVSASENTGVQVQVTQADGVVTGVTADLVWLGANDQPLA